VSSLRISEIFYSLQGEARTAGIPTVFIRLTGCPLRCVYCDTAYAFSGGEVLSLDDIVARVALYKPRYITVTGGEPLAQPACNALLSMLCDRGWQVSLETAGALTIEGIDPRVSVVMDLKTPSSGEVHRNVYSNVPLITQKDQLKFVIADRQDYEWSRMVIDQYALCDRTSEILFSPVWGKITPREIAGWILADNLPVRMQLQLHKLVWGEEQGR
jgi:7-carboxy-7-deazaguanine synthase